MHDPQHNAKISEIHVTPEAPRIPPLPTNCA
jgi:hypothetical protein